METHSSSPSSPSGPDDAPDAPPTPEQARAVLDALDADATQLSGRLASPWWYHLLLGGIVAAAIGAQALPAVTSATVIALIVIGIPLLMRDYTSRYRISMTRPAGPRSRRMLLLILAVLAVLMGAGVAVKLAALSHWWVLPLAAIGFVVTVVLGRAYDAVLRSEIADPAPTSATR